MWVAEISEELKLQLEHGEMHIVAGACMSSPRLPQRPCQPLSGLQPILSSCACLQ